MGASKSGERWVEVIVKILILAAGYGTRMRSVIGDAPKALVKFGSRTLLDHLYKRLRELEHSIVLVTNNLHYSLFLKWQEHSGADMVILNDGSNDAESRLGAIGDIAFALDQLQAEEDMLVVAADSLFDFSLTGLLEAFEARQVLHIGIWQNQNYTDQKRRGVVELDSDGQILSFKEKPTRPTSLTAAAPLYLLPANLIPAMTEYLSGGGNPDAPGYLMEHLVTRFPAFGWQLPGSIIDVGNPESYRRALTLLGR